MIDAYASQRHYFDHIAPIWNALPDRGVFHHRAPKPGGTIIVASRDDLRRVKHHQRIVFVEHGAGQTYLDNRTPGGYAGGPERGDVDLFICPNEKVADLNRRAYPQAKSVNTGSPRVEFLASRRRSPRHSPPAVAYSWHWNCHVSPEAKGAWEWYRNDLQVDRHTLGHGHPRIWGQLSKWWQTLGVEPVESFTELVDRCDVYVCDNSSTIYEAAALDIPVVLMNAPWYRKDVHHGLRFWEHLPGPQVENSAQIPSAIRESPDWGEERRRVTEAVYGQVNGSIGRAVEAIMEMVA